MLWRYVIVGDNRKQLDENNALIDLDHVLVGFHAKKHSPEFYKLIESATYSSGIIDQVDMLSHLDEALVDLEENLLEEEYKTPSTQSCFLRILDIFFHLFDQATLGEEFYELLVINSNTKALTKEAFYLRYSLDEYTDEGELSERLQKETALILADLNSDIDDINHKTLTKIEQVFDENRLAFDCSHWDPNEVGSIALASYLVMKDHQDKKDDQYSQKLITLIKDNFFNLLENILIDETKHDSTLPPQFIAALKQDDTPLTKELIAVIEQILSQNHDHISGTKKSPLGDTQPDYDLFNNSMSDYRALLTACYWLAETGLFPFANKILNFSLTLDPQRTLFFLAAPYTEDAFDNKFENKDLHKEFINKLMRLNVSETDIVTFNIYYAQKHEPKAYLHFINNYIPKWDKGLSRLIANKQQQFYLDVCRLGTEKPVHLLGDLSKVLIERLHKEIALPHQYIAAHFNENDLLHHGDVDCLPNRFKKLAIVEDTQMLNLPNHHVAVMQLIGNQLILLVNPFAETLSSLDELYHEHCIILNENVEREKIFLITSVMAEGNYSTHFTNMQQKISQLSDDYIQAKITFSEYQQQARFCVDLSEFDWEEETKRHRLLPFIFRMKNTEQRNRVIKLFLVEDNEESLEKIAVELFIESRLIAGNLAFEERLDWDREYMEDDLLQEFLAYRKTFEQQLAALK